MIIVNFSTEGTAPRPGILLDGDILPVDGLPGDAGALASIPELLMAGADVRAQITQATESDAALRIPRADVRLHAPIRPGAMIVCIGGNYRSHLKEIGQSEFERAPSFLKNANAVVGPEDPIVLPTEFPDMVDYEGELCAVFGRECHRVTAQEAMDYVAGYTILNDVSARDRMRTLFAATKPSEVTSLFIEVAMGKQFPSFAPVGPAILTADEVPDVRKLRLTTHVNGELTQDATLDDLIFGLPELIEQMSRYYSFAPGDLISTGTPGGNGVGQDPPRFLQPGDEVSVEVTGIGALTNRVISPRTRSSNA